jgi:hypothetical protein
MARTASKTKTTRGSKTTKTTKTTKTKATARQAAPQRRARKQEDAIKPLRKQFTKNELMAKIAEKTELEPRQVKAVIATIEALKSLR